LLFAHWLSTRGPRSSAILAALLVVRLRLHRGFGLCDILVLLRRGLSRLAPLSPPLGAAFFGLA
jgi:hypothetical protein